MRLSSARPLFIGGSGFLAMICRRVAFLAILGTIFHFLSVFGASSFEPSSSVLAAAEQGQLRGRGEFLQVSYQPAPVIGQPVIGEPVAVSATVGSATAVSGEKIYVPYRNWSTLLKDDDPTIFLPYSEYQRLRQQAASSVPLRPSALPISAVITESHYVARVEKSFVRMTASLTVKTLTDGWSRVALPFGGVAIGTMSSSNKEALLQSESDGSYSLLLRGRGVQQVTLELSAKVTSDLNGSEFWIGCPRVAISTIEVIVPQPKQLIEVSPQLIVLPNSNAGKTALEKAAAALKERAHSTRLKVGLGSTSQIIVRWRPEIAKQPKQQLLATVKQLTRITLRDSLVLTHAQLTYQVHRGALTRLTIAVPLTHRILDISGPVVSVASSTTEKQAKQQLVTVVLSGPITKSLTIHVHTERPLTEKEVAGATDGRSPLKLAGVGDDEVSYGIHATNVARENGYLILEHDVNSVLAVTHSAEWIRAVAGDVPFSSRRPRCLYYRFFNTKSLLSVMVHAVKPRITVEQKSNFIVTDKHLELQLVMNYKVEHVGVFDLRLRVPKELTITNVVTDDLKDFGWDGEAVGDERIFKISYHRRVLGSRRVFLSGHHRLEINKKTEKKNGSQPLPLLEPLGIGGRGVALEHGVISLFASPSRTVIVDPKTLVGFQPAVGSGGGETSKGRLISSWAYFRRPVHMDIRVEAVPTRVSATVETVVDVRETTVSVQTDLRYQIEHSPTAFFQFRLPRAAVGRLRVNDVNGQSVAFQISGEVAGAKKDGEKADGDKADGDKADGDKADGDKADGDKADGEKADDKKAGNKKADDKNWVTVTLTVPKPVLGTLLFRVSYELEPVIGLVREGDADDAAKERALLLQPIRVLLPKTNEIAAVSELLGVVFVGGERSFKIDVAANGGDIEAIDSRKLRSEHDDLAIGTKTDGDFYRYHQEAVTLQLLITKLAVQPVVQTVVSKALVEMMIGSDDVTYRCRYLVVSSERQRLRFDLPKTAELLGALVNGKKIDYLEKSLVPSQEEEFVAYLLDVTREETSDEPFTIVVQFRLKMDPKPFDSAFGKLRLFLPRIGSGEKYSTVVQELRTAIWLPRKMALTGNVSKFERRTWTRLTGLLPDQFIADKETVALEEWIDIDSRHFEFVTEGHVYRFDNLGGSDRIEVSYTDISTATWILSIPLLLIGWVLARTSWENKLGVLLLLLFVVTLFSLKDVDWVYHGLFIARYGFAAMFGWWAIHGLLSKGGLFGKEGPFGEDGLFSQWSAVPIFDGIGAGAAAVESAAVEPAAVEPERDSSAKSDSPVKKESPPKKDSSSQKKSPGKNDKKDEPPEKG